MPEMQTETGTVLVRYPIVGMFYRPPAMALVNNLFLGAELYLLAEPDNEVDPNAIAVYLPKTTLTQITNTEQFANALSGFGTDLASLIDSDSNIKLGYIPKHFAKHERGIEGFPLDTKIAGSFVVSADGGPRIVFERSWKGS